MASRSVSSRREREAQAEAAREKRRQRVYLRAVSAAQRAVRQAREASFDDLREGDMLLITNAADALTQAVERAFSDAEERRKTRALYAGEKATP